MELNSELLLWDVLVSGWRAKIDGSIGTWGGVVSPVDWGQSFQVHEFVWSWIGFDALHGWKGFDKTWLADVL